MRCDNSTGRSNRAKGGFNPHTYMRCDTHARDIQWCQAVSIHTPTWGVTLLSEVPDRIIRFQSTHLHEVWPRPLSGRWSGTSFNPHTYMRCDFRFSTMQSMISLFQSTHLHEVWPAYLEYLDSILPVSIHTPTWGVTFTHFSRTLSGKFQSTHLHEVWLSVSFPYNHTISFNPHTYMRCDYRTWRLDRLYYCFNPHTYMRCDRVKSSEMI